MFGNSILSRQRLAETYGRSFLPFRDGYIYKSDRGSDPIFVTQAEREFITARVVPAAQKGLRIGMVLLIAGALAWIGWAVVFDSDPHFWVVVPLMALMAPGYFLPRAASRAAVSELGPRHVTVFREDYERGVAQWRRDTPWSAIIVPCIALLAGGLRMHPHWPVRSSDDAAELAVLAIGFGLFASAAIRKLKAGGAA